MNLGQRIPDGGFSSPDEALDVFIAWVAELGLSLYPAQEEALLELYDGAHVILDTPTGSGKSMVALALHFRELSAGRRSIYTAPIKALVSEKYRALVETFGTEHVGMMTGDGSINRDAPILCCTAEILAKLAVRHGEETPFQAVVMDEFHFYGDRDRGMAWQLPLLTMPHSQFLLMSATLGDTKAIEADLAERTGRSVSVVSSVERPVPLEFSYRMSPLDASIRDLISGNKAPIYAVHFTQRAASEHAQALLSSDYASSEEKAAIKVAVGRFRFDSPFGPALRRMALHGVGLHHAGLLPKYRMLVERLAQAGHFKVICGTDTLGVGINVPIRTVLFTQLCKYDGLEVNTLTARHFKQIAGRAGRKGYDDVGFVAAQAPEWVIENRRIDAAVEAGKKKRNKVVRKKPPTRGYKHWDEATFDVLTTRPPKALTPQFRVDHGLVLTLLQRAGETLGDGMADLHGLIDRSHASARAKVRLHGEADIRLEELVHGMVVVDHGPDAEPRYIVHTDLQDDFSLHHALSLYLLHALEQLDPEQPDFALQVLSQVESILENPGVVLSAQTQRQKRDVLAELKARGVPYEERIEALEEVSYPKPMADWIYATYNAYKDEHPWLTEAPIRPKGIVREMVETQAVFSAMVKELQLQRAEGVLLRYCSQVYRAVLQNVPESMRTPEIVDVLGYLRALLARVDDSLVTAWEMQTAPTAEDAGPAPLWADPKALRARIRAELYAMVRALAVGDYAEAAANVRDAEDAWTDVDFERALAPYLEERGPVVFDGRIRQGWTTQFEELSPQVWIVRQILVDSLDAEEQDSAWAIEGRVDLSGDANPAGPLVEVTALTE